MASVRNDCGGFGHVWLEFYGSDGTRLCSRERVGFPKSRGRNSLPFLELVCGYRRCRPLFELFKLDENPSIGNLEHDMIYNYFDFQIRPTDFLQILNQPAASLIFPCAGLPSLQLPISSILLQSGMSTLFPITPSSFFAFFLSLDVVGV